MISSLDQFLLRAHLVAAIGALTACVFWPEARLLAVAFLIIAIVALIVFRSRLRGTGMIVATALMFTASVHLINSWLSPAFLNKWSDAPFARAIHDRVGADQPLTLIGGGLREDVLFYLGGRTVPKVDSVTKIADDYHGFAIVTADQYDAVRASNRGEEISVSADRNPENRMYFFRIPAKQ